MTTVEGRGALLVPVDGPPRHVVLPTADQSALAALHEHTSSEYVEHVIGPVIVCEATGRAVALSLWVDEEGAISLPPKPPNPRIDALLRRSDGWSIRGDVLITGEIDAPGDFTSLHPDAVAELRGRWS